MDTNFFLKTVFAEIGMKNKFRYLYEQHTKETVINGKIIKVTKKMKLY